MDDPRIEQLRTTFHDRAPATASRQHGAFEAAVTLLVRPRAHLELLLIRRAESRGDPWSGHVALPGGRRAAADDSLLVTACREAAEEVGIDAATHGALIGALDELAPDSPRLPPFVIAPFILAVPSDTVAQPSPREVQAAIWVPVDALRDTAALSEVSIPFPDGDATFPCLVYHDYVIWGLTYRIITQFLAVTGGA